MKDPTADPQDDQQPDPQVGPGSHDAYRPPVTPEEPDQEAQQPPEDDPGAAGAPREAAPEPAAEEESPYLYSKWEPPPLEPPLPANPLDDPVPTEESPSAERGIKPLLVAVVLLILVAIAAGGAALKLWSDRAEAQHALMAAVGAMSATTSPEMAGHVGSRLERVRDAVDRGRFSEAAARLETITEGTGAFPLGEPGMDLAPPAFPGARGPGDGPPRGPREQDEPPGPPSGQEAAGDLPPDALEFFRRNERLAQLFAQANMAGLQLRERGGDVTGLRRLRSSMVEAARMGDEGRLVELLEAFQGEFEAQARKLQGPPPQAPGAGPGPPGRPPVPRGRPSAPPGPPRELMTTARQVSEALERAQAEGRDLRHVMPLLRQADQAGGAGDFAAATRLSQQALEAIRRAPEMPPQPQMFENPLVAMFLDLIRVEDQELSATLAAMRQAYESAKDRTTDRLAQSMKQAIDVLAGVGQRRRSFSERVQQMRGPEPVHLPQQDHQATQEQMQARAEEVRQEIADILARAQDMTPEEFAAAREALVDDLLQAVFAPQEPRVARPLPAAPAREPLSQEDRVRAKLLRAAEPYLVVRYDPDREELAAELDDVFSRARAALARGDSAEAEELTDRGLVLLGLEEEPQPATPEPDPEERPDGWELWAPDGQTILPLDRPAPPARSRNDTTATER